MVELLEKFFYVDDFIVGEEDDESVFVVYKKLK